MIAIAVAAGLALLEPALPRQQMHAEIVALENDRIAAMKRRDRPVLERDFAREYRHVNFGGDVTDRAAEIDFYTAPSFRLGSGEVKSATTELFGDTVVMRADIEWRDASFQPAPTTTVDLSGRFTVTRVYIRRDGRWQAVASHASKRP